MGTENRRTIVRTETDGATLGELKEFLQMFPDSMRIVVRGYELGVDDLQLLAEIYIEPGGSRKEPEEAAWVGSSMVTNADLVDGGYYGPHRVLAAGDTGGELVLYLGATDPQRLK